MQDTNVCIHAIFRLYNIVTYNWWQDLMELTSLSVRAKHPSFRTHLTAKWCPVMFVASKLPQKLAGYIKNNLPGYIHLHLFVDQLSQQDGTPT